jgi:hypothetical protein
MATQVVNPTNAPPNPFQALPFQQMKSATALTLKRTPRGDVLNTGVDYPDEAIPLFTMNPTQKFPPAMSMVPGIVDPPTKEEIAALKDPDAAAQGKVTYPKDAVVMDIDAKLITSTVSEMRNGRFRESHYPSMEQYVKSPYYRRLRESAITLGALVGRKPEVGRPSVSGIRLNPQLVKRFASVDRSVIKQLRESKRFREFDSFAMDGPASGAFAGQLATNWDGGLSFERAGRTPDFTPLLAGPYNKQLYFFDYLDMHSKAFEAWTHNPIAKRICKVITQFVLGKGVRVTVMNAERPTGNVVQSQNGPQPEVEDWREEAQEILDTHWRLNSLHIRSKQILRDLIIFGEQFVRYFDAQWGLRIRQIDPSTVWEIVTDPDDAENEFYLHQQYPTRYQWFVDLPVPTIKFIIRQVPALQYYHMKINTVSGEVRGRSELFALLGWLKRLKEFASDRVIRNKMANLFVLDVAVEGDQGAVDVAKQQFSVPPTPGSFFIHNKAAELNGIRAEVGGSDVTADWDMLLTIMSTGAGISQEYLGLPGAGGKAQALVGTEPDIKTFEDYQELMEAFFNQDSDRVFARAKDQGKLPRELAIRTEVTYPALAEENRSEKLKDLAFGESMSWWSHRRVSSAAAKEMQFTSYDYDEEQEEIAMEDAKKDFLINTAYQQVIKGTDSATAQGGGTSSGSSGKGASGMGMGKMGSGGGSKQSESVRESAPATAPGSSAGSSVSGMAVTHNASVGADGKRDPWSGRDPRDMASTIKREAANLRYDRHGVSDRLRNRHTGPSQMRDQKSMDRGILTKTKRAMRRGYNEAEIPDSDLHEVRTIRRREERRIQAAVDRGDRIIRFPRLSRESMEPFKTEDGERMQRHDRIENFPTEKNAHHVVTGQRNRPRGYAALKRA